MSSSVPKDLRASSRASKEILPLILQRNKRRISADNNEHQFNYRINNHPHSRVNDSTAVGWVSNLKLISVHVISTNDNIMTCGTHV